MSIDIDNCGSVIKVTQYVLVVGCPTYNKSRGKVSILERNTLETIQEYEGEYENAQFGAVIQTLEFVEGI